MFTIMPVGRLVNRRTTQEAVLMLIGFTAVLSAVQSVSVPQHFPGRTVTQEEEEECCNDHL